MADKLTHKKNATCDSYIWKQLYCEICKHPYSSKLLEKQGILEYQVPQDSSYMILEQISSVKEQKQICVVNLDREDEFTIGRCKDSDI